MISLGQRDADMCVGSSGTLEPARGFIIENLSWCQRHANPLPVQASRLNQSECKRSAYSKTFAMPENIRIFITMQRNASTDELYFVTLTVVDWIDVFTRR